MAQPPFLLTYYNPFSDDPKKNSLVGSYIDYVKNTSLAKYSADVMGSYLEETSSSQLAATESIGRAICGELYDAFSSLQTQLKQTDLRQTKQLGEISGDIRQISSELRQVFGALEVVNQRLDLMRDEIKTSNVLLENIGELLRISDSQKQRQHHIELALKFLKNAQKDQDLYQDALNYLLKAEKLEPEDYFVLHRIGMIYLYAPDLIDLEKALDYFTRAAKYAAVEGNPGAVRLSNVLNKRVNKKFADQADHLPDKESDATAESFEDSISALAAESYFQAGSALYALGRFDEAVKMAEKAVARKGAEPKYILFWAKYLTRSGKPEDAVKQLLKAIEIAPEMAIAAVGDYDLNRSKPILDALNQINNCADSELKNGIEHLQQWIKKNSLNDDDLLAWMTEAAEGLKGASYPKKRALLSTFKEYKELLNKLESIIGVGFKFDLELAFKLLKQNDRKQVNRISTERISSNYIKEPGLATLKNGGDVSYLYEILFATADESYFGLIGSTKWETESDTTPAIGEDGMVYFGLKNELIALDKETGKECWRFFAGGSVGAPMVGGYMVFFGAGNNFSSLNDLFALDGRTGRKIWTHGGAGDVRFLNGDGIIISDTGASIYALEGNTGKELWRFTKTKALYKSISGYANGSIIVGGGNRLVSIDSKSGNILWDVETLSEVNRRVHTDEVLRRSEETGELYPSVYGNRVVTNEFTGAVSIVYDYANDSIYFVSTSLFQDITEYSPFDDTEVVPSNLKDEHITRRSHNIAKFSGASGEMLWNQKMERPENADTIRANIAIDDESCLYLGLQDKLNKIDPDGGSLCVLPNTNVDNSHRETNPRRFKGQVRGVAIGYGLIYLVTHSVDCNEVGIYFIDKKSGLIRNHKTILECAEVNWCPIIIDIDGMILLQYGKKIYCIYSQSERETEAFWPMFRQNPQATGCAKKPQFRIPTQEEIDREIAALAEKLKNEERKRLEVEAAEKARKEEEERVELERKRVEYESAEKVRMEYHASDCLAKAKAAEEAEKAKWFRKKNFSSALELYRQAAAAGSTEATAKVEELTKLIAVK